MSVETHRPGDSEIPLLEGSGHAHLQDMGKANPDRQGGLSSHHVRARSGCTKRKLHRKLAQDAELYIAEAIDRVESKSWAKDRYRGELTNVELALGKRSDFGWVFQTLTAMPQDLVLPCFGEAGKTFLSICNDTFGQRKKRQTEGYLASLVEVEKPERRVQVKKPARFYLPQPSRTPQDMARLFADYTVLSMPA